MTTATSKVDICNLALDYLLQTDEEGVTNIDTPETPTEVVCGRWYDVARRAVLRKHPWNFAIKRAQLTEAVPAPLFGFNTAFNLPNDFLRLLTIQDNADLEIIPFPRFELESRQILIDTDTNAASTLNIRYIFNQESVTVFDALFLDILAIELATRIAYKFTSSNTDVQRLEALLAEKLGGARSIDGQERPPIRKERSRARTRRRLLGSNQRSGIFFD